MVDSRLDAGDRFEIEELLARYSYGIDERMWSAWNDLFSRDAVLDYSEIGLGRLSPDDFRRRISENDASRISGQHLHSNLLFSTDGDEAKVEAEYTMVVTSRSTRPGYLLRVRAGGRCAYRLVHDDGRWRIRHRTTMPKWRETSEHPLPSVSADDGGSAWEGQESS